MSPAAKLPEPLTRWRCEPCESEWTDDEPSPLRECSSEQCGEVFVADGDNNCPTCARPFTRRLADYGCPDCFDPDGMEEQEGFACRHGSACPVGGFHVVEDEGVDTDAPEWALPDDATSKQTKAWNDRLRKAEAASRAAAIKVAVEAAERCEGAREPADDEREVPQAIALRAPEVLQSHHAMTEALATCHRMHEVKDFRGKAIALAAYARQAKDDALLSSALEVKLRAERRAGELLTEMAERQERHGRGQEMSSPDDIKPPTLADLGITRDQSSDWQKLARMPPDRFEDYLQDVIHPARRYRRDDPTEESTMTVVPGFAEEPTEEEAPPSTMVAIRPEKPPRPEMRELFLYVERQLAFVEEASAVLLGIEDQIERAERDGVFIFESDLPGLRGAVTHLGQVAERVLARLRMEREPVEEAPEPSTSAPTS